MPRVGWPCNKFHCPPARATGALSHAGIVAVHAFDVSSDDQAYLVMDYVEGAPLSEIFAKEGCLSEKRCIELALQAADALSYAHQQGIVHRDIKPSNIMLVPPSGSEMGSGAGSGAGSGSVASTGVESIKIVDFGIAKITTPENGQALTKTGEVFGSPLYMSPEQCSGAKIDERSDIYSLGCVLYEALVGHPPHIGETPVATAVKHLQEEPVRLRLARPDLKLSEAIEKIVAKALAKNVKNRYQSMREFQADLRKVAEGKELSALAANVPAKVGSARMNYLVLGCGVLLLVGVSFAVKLVEVMSGHSFNNVYDRFMFEIGPQLIGCNLCVLALILLRERPVYKAHSAFEWFSDEFDAMQKSAARLTPKAWRVMALIFIVELLLIGVLLVMR